MWHSGIKLPIHRHWSSYSVCTLTSRADTHTRTLNQYLCDGGDLSTSISNSKVGSWKSSPLSSTSTSSVVVFVGIQWLLVRSKPVILCFNTYPNPWQSHTNTYSCTEHTLTRASSLFNSNEEIFCARWAALERCAVGGKNASTPTAEQSRRCGRRGKGNEGKNSGHEKLIEYK